jgi:CDP-diglyceride synthetase
VPLTARPEKRPAAKKSAPAKKTAAGKKPSSGRAKAAPARKPTPAILPVAFGLVWTIVLIAALVVSSLATVVVMAAVGVIATASGVRSAGSRSRDPRRMSRHLVAALVAVVLVPLIALAGPLAAAGALAVFGGGVIVLDGLAVMSLTRPARSFARLVVASLTPMVAVTCVVIARHQGTTLALALVIGTFAYDLGAFIMGNGRGALGGWVGIVFGVASVAVVAVFVAAILDPPFSGARPWVVFAGVALLAPAGVWLCQRATGGERLPAARRFDSLALTAPFWVLAAALLLHR